MAFIDQPKLDRTSRDRAAIINDFIRPGGYLEQRFGAEFIEFAQTEIGFAMIDLIAGIGDTFNAAADRVGNEGFMATAQEVQSVIDHGRGLGYTPRGNVPSRWNLTFTTTFNDEIQIAAGRIILTNPAFGEQIPFEVESAATKAAGATSTTITVVAGRPISHGSFVSSGSGIQTTELIRPGVIDGSIRYVVDGVTWTQVEEFDDSGPNDLHFRVRVREEIPGQRISIIESGDGQNGRIPPAGSTVAINYRVGGGRASNVPLNSIDRFEFPLVDASNNVIPFTMTNPAAALQLGQDQESKDEIRINAPVFARTNERMVSNRDHEDAARNGGALRALAITNNESDLPFENTVLVFVASSLTIATTQAEADAIETAMLTAFPGRSTRRLNVIPAIPLSFTWTMNVVIRQSANEGVIRPLIDAALQAFFATDALIGNPPRFVQDIGRTVYKSNVERMADQVAGVVSVDITNPDAVPLPYQLPITDLSTWTINITKET